MGFKFYAPAEEKPSKVKSLATIQEVGASTETEMLETSDFSYLLEIVGKLAEDAADNKLSREIYHISFQNVNAIFEKIAKDEKDRKELFAQIDREIGYLKKADEHLAESLAKGMKKLVGMYNQLYGMVSHLRDLRLEELQSLDREMKDSERRLGLYSDDDEI